VISAVATPEEQLIDQEDERLWDSRMFFLRENVRRVITSFPPEYVRIARLWSERKTLKKISEETGMALETARRRLKEVQKAVIKEAGIIRTSDNKALVNLGLRELFASSLQRQV
jgi:Holliday junction resolvasome RuvABC endonuclease subunit